MVRTIRRVPCGMVFALTICGVLLISVNASAVGVGGTCPSAANYLNTTTNTLVTLSSLGITSCYFISAAGADTNNGTSESTPWLHAPGMTNCAGTCASTTPAAGNGFIFRGNDSWHTSASSPIGLPWTWSWNGNSTNGIYIGVDKTWYSGSSWARPILTMDNPLSSTFVSSCAYDDASITPVWLYASHLTFDNFEFTGKCWASQPNQHSSIHYGPGTYITMSNLYIHGWSAVVNKGNGWDHQVMVQGDGSNNGVLSHNVFVGGVIDGSDSSHDIGGSANCTPVANSGSPCNSGFAMYFDAYDVHNSVFRWLSNGIVGTTMYTMHDNLFEYIYNSYDDATHPNVIEAVGTLSNENWYFYNNVIRYTRANITYTPQWSLTAYEFNNVFFENNNGEPGTGPNCFMQSPNLSSDRPVAYIYNNTFAGDDGICTVNFFPGNPSTPTWNGTAYFENNHFIGYGGSSISSVYACPSPSVCTVNDNGHEVFQSVSTANAQGYTPSNNYQPTSGGSTIGAGANLTSSCLIFSSDSALCSGTSMGASEVGGSGGYIAFYPATTIVPRPPSGNWDAGAYQSSANPPQPATNVVATPH